MIMKIVYIAHPVGGDVKGNIKKIVEIGREINMNNQGVVPIAPYIFDLLCLNDDVQEERARGMANGEALFLRKFIDEVWVYGDRISSGVRSEILMARELGIPVIPKTKQVKNEI